MVPFGQVRGARLAGSEGVGGVDGTVGVDGTAGVLGETVPVDPVDELPASG